MHGLITAAALFLVFTLAAQESPSRQDSRVADDLAELVANSDAIVHATIRGSRDLTAIDGGVHYECDVSKSLVGSLRPGQSLRFVSGGGWGTQRAHYWPNERVILFLKSRDGVVETPSNPLYVQLRPYTYIEKRRGLQLSDFPDYDTMLSSEIEKR